MALCRCAPAQYWPKIEKGAAGGPTCGSKCPPVPPPPKHKQAGAKVRCKQMQRDPRLQVVISFARHLTTLTQCGRWRLSQVPEAAWLLRQLLEYAYTGPKPTKGLAVKVTECPGCMPSSFVALCGA